MVTSVDPAARAASASRSAWAATVSPAREYRWARSLRAAARTKPLRPPSASASHTASRATVISCCERAATLRATRARAETSSVPGRATVTLRTRAWSPLASRAAALASTTGGRGGRVSRSATASATRPDWTRSSAPRRAKAGRPRPTRAGTLGARSAWTLRVLQCLRRILLSVGSVGAVASCCRRSMAAAGSTVASRRAVRTRAASWAGPPWLAIRPSASTSSLATAATRARSARGVTGDRRSPRAAVAGSIGPRSEGSHPRQGDAGRAAGGWPGALEQQVDLLPVLHPLLHLVTARHRWRVRLVHRRLGAEFQRSARKAPRTGEPGVSVSRPGRAAAATIQSNSGWKLNQPARWAPTCARGERRHLGVDRDRACRPPRPGAATWQERSMVMNHQAASSTEWPTVSRPWLRRMAALSSPRAWAMRLPSSGSSDHAGVVVEQRVVARRRRTASWVSGSSSAAEGRAGLAVDCSGSGRRPPRRGGRRGSASGWRRRPG